MAGEWQRKAFGDCATLVRETVLPEEARGLPYIGLEHIAEGSLSLITFGSADDVTSIKLHFRRNDILFGKLRPYFRKVIRAPFDGICSTDIWVVRPKNGIDATFLFYWMASPEFIDAATRGSEGTKMPRAQWEFVSRITQPVPPLSEQRAIARILGTLDDKIELNRRMNETVEQMARAIFKSWFVDFDPVIDNALRARNPIPSVLAEKAARRRELLARAKSEGRDTCFPKHIAALFPDRFVDSELGPIPAGWRVGKLSDLCSTQYGYTASAVDESIGPKLLRVTDINKRDWIEWNEVPHCAIDPDIKEFYALQVGDLVVARMADPGRSAIIEEEVDAVFASYLVRLKTESLAHSYYIIGFLKSALYAEYVAGAKSGSVQASMNAKVIVGADLVVPPIKVMEKFLEAVLPFRQRLMANLRESGTLTYLRDSLLPKLVSGNIRLKNPY